VVQEEKYGKTGKKKRVKIKKKRRYLYLDQFVSFFFLFLKIAIKSALEQFKKGGVGVTLKDTGTYTASSRKANREKEVERETAKAQKRTEIERSVRRFIYATEGIVAIRVGFDSKSRVFSSTSEFEAIIHTDFAT